MALSPKISFRSVLHDRRTAIRGARTHPGAAGASRKRECYRQAIEFIVLDASVLLRYPRLTGVAMSVLLAEIAIGGVAVFVPEVAVRETAAGFGRRFEEHLTKLRAAARELRRLGLQVSEPSQESADLRAEYERWFRGALAEHGATVLPIPPVDLGALVDSACARRKPFDDKGSGFRDALVWQSVLDLARERRHTITFLTSDNDFYAASGSDQMAPELLEATAAAGVEVQVVRSLEDFVRNRITDDPNLYQAVSALLERERSQLGVNVWAAVSATEITVIDAHAEVIFNRFGRVDLRLVSAGAVPNLPDLALLQLDVTAEAEVDAEGYRITDDSHFSGTFDTTLHFAAFAHFDKRERNIESIEIPEIRLYIEEIIGPQ